jgi:hypothetical protein
MGTGMSLNALINGHYTHCSCFYLNFSILFSCSFSKRIKFHIPRRRISNPDRIAAKIIGFIIIPIVDGDIDNAHKIRNKKFKTIATR